LRRRTNPSSFGVIARAVSASTRTNARRLDRRNFARLFILAWHLLTKYRVCFSSAHQCSSPLSVYEELYQGDPRSEIPVAHPLSCRRIVLGFSMAALVGVPLGLVMGGSSCVHG